MKLSNIREMIAKEIAQALRDKRMRGLLFVVPVVQLLVFGYAVTFDVRHLPTAVYDGDHSPESRAFVSRLEGSGYFTVARTAARPGGLDGELASGRASVAVRIDRGMGRRQHAAPPAPVQVIVDASDSNTATLAGNYLQGVVQTLDPRPSAAVLQPRVWYNPDLRSRNYNVPGVIAMIIMLQGILLTALAVVREKEIGTLEQLRVTPLTPAEFVLGKTLPFAFIVLFVMLVILTAGLLLFGIPMRGSLALLMACSVAYVFPVLSIGLFISAVCRNQQQAVMLSFLVLNPALLLSGFIFPLENMPDPVQWLTYANPLRFFLVIVRGILLKGSGLDVLWPQAAALLALGLAFSTASYLRFRHRGGL